MTSHERLAPAWMRECSREAGAAESRARKRGGYMHRRHRALTRFGIAAAGPAAGLGALLVGGFLVAPSANAIANGQDVPDGRYRFSAALSMPLITRPDGS